MLYSGDPNTEHSNNRTVWLTNFWKFVIQAISQETFDLKNELLIRYSIHGLNNFVLFLQKSYFFMTIGHIITNKILIVYFFYPTLSSNNSLPPLWKVSSSIPHPDFSNWMQNDVTSVHPCWTGFRKKTVVYYYLLVLLFRSQLYLKKIQSWRLINDIPLPF